MVVNDESGFSKRTVLSKIAEIWDSLGMLSGVLTSSKLILQSIVWRKKNWDEKFDDPELLHKWKLWVTEIKKCNGLVVSHSLLPTKVFSAQPLCSLIGFSD